MNVFHVARMLASPALGSLEYPSYHPKRHDTPEHIQTAKQEQAEFKRLKRQLRNLCGPGVAIPKSWDSSRLALLVEEIAADSDHWMRVD